MPIILRTECSAHEGGPGVCGLFPAYLRALRAAGPLADRPELSGSSAELGWI